jgi:outer membrane receptor protein involved in Fe transport
LIGDYTQANNSFNGQKIAPGTVGNPAFFTPQPDQSPWDMYSDANPLFRNTNGGASLKVEQSFAALNVTSLTAYRNSRTSLYWDVDFTPTPHLTGDLRDLESQISEELTFSSKPADTLTWQAGVFYFHADGSYDPAGVYSNDLFGPFHYVAPFGRQVTDSAAVFAQATFELAEATNLTLGTRYNHEKRDISGHTDGYLDGIDAPVSLGVTPPASLSFNKPTWRVALDHRFSPAILGYMSFNTGFKSGGFNTQFVSQPSFLPESLKAYEIGTKSDLLGRRLRLNVAAFDYEYTNIQVQKVGVASTGIINGASARVRGVDADFEAIITDNFNITGSAAYLHAKFRDFQDAPFGSPEGGVASAPGDASGNDIPKSPHFTGNLTGDYRFGLSDGSSVNLLATYQFNSGFYFEADNLLRQKAFSRVNAALKWQSAGGRYWVRVWGDNLTNEAVLSYSSTLSDGTRNVTYEAPRQYGVTLGIALQ